MTKPKHIQPVPDAPADGVPEGLFDQVPIAQMLEVEIKTLESWRVKGFGPKYMKVGRLVRYRLSDVRAWLDSRTVSSTSE